MKNGLNNKKTIILSALVIIMLALTGGIFYTPELKNADKPFIELSGSIGTAIGNANDAYADEHKQPDPPQEDGEETPSSTEPQKEEQSDSKIEIVVTGEEIKIGMKSVDDFSEFDTVIRGEAFDGKEFEIVDDFGEFKTTRRIIKLFDKLGKNYSIRQVEE